MTNLDQAGAKPKPKIVDIVEVKRHGDALVIPESLTLERADAAIHARMAYESEVVSIHAPIKAPFVFEGAYALHEVLTARFGWANGVPTPGFFGPTPPAMLAVPIDIDKTVQVPWGRFSVPNVDGYLEANMETDDLGVTRFVISGQVKRMHEAIVNEIVEAVQTRVQHHSIYKGKAFRVRLYDDVGRRMPMPEPRFLDLSKRVESELILPEDTDESVRTNIFTLIERTADVTEIGIPLKRGVLLAGPFGTGKTMIARVTAEKSVDHSWTYVEVERIHEFAEVARLVVGYGDKQGGIVLFCEDIDRIMSGDERSEGIDMVLNVIDGVESKGSAMMVVLTTNDLDGITSAMLRPGRLDAIIPVNPPDGQAAIRLARQYGRGLIDPADPLTESEKVLGGNIPAVIREAVERSKLRALRLTPPGQPLVVTDAALAGAAKEMANHIALLTPAEPDKRSETVKAADVLANAARETGVLFGFQPVTPHPWATVEGFLPDSQSNGSTGKRRGKKSADEAPSAN